METAAAASTSAWPAHLTRLCASLRAGGAGRDRARADAWVLLRDALIRYLRAHAARMPALRRDDLEDLASTKALELLTRAESGEWDPEGRHPGEVAGYVAAVARHAVWRWAEQQERRRTANLPIEEMEPERTESLTSRTAPTESVAEAGEFVHAFRDCVGGLAPRARRVWFFRAFYELSSREIAAHPDVSLNAAHVDVVVKRARDALRSCLEGKGHGSRDLPVGVFTSLWESLGTFAEVLALEPAGERPRVS